MTATLKPIFVPLGLSVDLEYLNATEGQDYDYDVEAQVSAYRDPVAYVKTGYNTHNGGANKDWVTTDHKLKPDEPDGPLFD